MPNKSDAEQFLESLSGGPLTFGRLIRSIRLGEELSLDSFADKLEVSRSNLSDIEHGRRGVSVARAIEWAQLLGYGPTQFVELALQAQVDAAGLEGHHVEVKKGPRKKSGARPMPTASKRNVA
jgi:transcriptional regulator with XRE-family HTH domain